MILPFQINQTIRPIQAGNGDETIIYAMPYDFDEYSIFTADSYASAQWMSAVYVGLVKRESTGRWLPDLAENLPLISSNGTVYTFKLKDNLLFSNGHVLDSSDVAFSFKAALTPKINLNAYDQYIGFLNNNSIRIIDESTIEFTLLQQYAFPLGLLNFPITDEALFSSRYDQCEGGILDDCIWNNELGQDVISAGPFMVFDIDNVNEIVTLDANPYYFNANQVKTDRIIFQKIAEKDAAVSALAGGLIDLLDSQYVPGLNELSSIAGITEVFIGDPSHQEISLNHLNPFFGTGENIPGNNGISNYSAALNVRKAMSHIMDRQFAVEKVMEGLAIPASTVMPAASIGWDSSLVPRNFSTSTAMSYMEMAGFDYDNAGTQDSFGVWSIPFFEITVMSPNTGSARLQWQPEYVLELPKIGISVKEHVSTGWGEIIPRTFGYADGLPPSHAEGGFDVFFVGYGWSLDWNPKGLYDSSGRCDTGDCGNFYNFDLDETVTDVADLVRAYLSELDFDGRLLKVKAIQAELYKWVPVIPIFYPQSHWGANDNLAGLDYLLLSSGQQDWSKVEIEGSSLNTKITDIVSGEISNSGDNSVSTSLAEFRFQIVFSFSVGVLVILNRRKFSY